MTPQEPYTGRHRATTVPRHWNRPDGRRHLNGTPGFDWATLPDHLQVHASPTPPVRPPGELPADGWSEARVPDFDQTGSFSPEDIAVALGRLPEALEGDDPEPTGPLPCWATGPLPVVATTPPADPRSTLLYLALAGFSVIGLVAYVLFSLAVAPPT